VTGARFAAGQRQRPPTKVKPPRLERQLGETQTAPERGGRLHLPGTHAYPLLPLRPRPHLQ